MLKTIRFFWAGLASLTLALALMALTANAANAQVNLTVDWSATTGANGNGWLYGLNLFQGLDPAQSGNATYRANLAVMKPGIVRYHRWDMIDDSTTNASGWATGIGAGQTVGWNATKINNALSGVNTWGATVMVNIPGWPSKWALSNGRLDPAHYTDYANWCANLVTIININQGRAVKYWEVPNERDAPYSGFDGGAELGRLFVQCRNAMRAVDSSIKVGGPAFANPYNTDHVNGFLSTAAATVDFVSYHTYSSGSTSDTNQTIFNSAAGVGYATTLIKQRIAAYTSRTVETFHDEYNISYAPPDARMNNEIGMIFDALSMISIVNAGATGSMAWNECDGWYGKLDGSFNRRSSSYLYEIFNTDMGGSVVNTSTADAAKAVVLGVKGGSWFKMAMVNRAESDQSVKFTTFAGMPAGTTASTAFNVKRIASWGIAYSSVTLGTLQSGYTLPANTVTVLVLDTSTIPPPAGNGTLTATSAAAPSSVNLTSQGTADWAHWGLATNLSLTNHGYDHKSGANKIGDFTVLVADSVERLTDATTSSAWTGGTPTASAANTTTTIGLYKWWTEGSGFRLTIPAGTATQTLRLYCGTYNANGILTATLSDNSAPVVTKTHTGVGYNKADNLYTITFKAGSANQTLKIEFVTNGNLGSYSPSEVRLTGATLQ